RKSNSTTFSQDEAMAAKIGGELVFFGDFVNVFGAVGIYAK
ncbi:10023_t:CDS:1, partial [Cetraspora pellucida]